LHAVTMAVLAGDFEGRCALVVGIFLAVARENWPNAFSQIASEAGSESGRRPLRGCFSGDAAAILR